ncbi:MAG: 3-dehydroquinate synthase [Alphaproteobacteria bacterium]|nr:3-dehydroquinate synthase [Alphaproteobacteria bacterium]
MTTPPALAEQARFVPGKIITVDFAEAATSPSYDIVIGHSILTEAATLIRLRLGARRCVIISDSIVEPLYGARLEAILVAGGHTVLDTLVFPAGEASKNFAQLHELLDNILTLGADRQTLIIALGGGVVGDLAGLAASLALRGLDLVQIPTTLLSQVDSSVGGKTGIDTACGKNTVGTFYQPRLVLADVTLLDSLPARELRAGYAEAVKYGLISDSAFFRWCVTHGGQLLNGDSESQIHAIGYSCAAKAKIVSADEREAGSRALLNLGHTFGHALEAATGFGNLLVHGEAVAIGILMAFRLSVRLRLCSMRDYDEIHAHFASVGLPTKPPSFDYDIPRLIDLMKQDKKAEGGDITLVLSRGIGQAFVCRDTDIRALTNEDPTGLITAVWREFTGS